MSFGKIFVITCFAIFASCIIYLSLAIFSKNAGHGKLHSKKRAAIATAILLTSIMAGTVYVTLINPKVFSGKKAYDDSAIRKSISVIASTKTKAVSDNDKTTYQFMNSYGSDKQSGQRFAYYTTATTNDELSQVNDAVVDSLRQSGKIDDQTKSYYIDYFSTEAAAKDYYNIAYSKTSSNQDKLKYIAYYIACMQYYPGLQINQLVRMPYAQTIKKY